MFLECNTAYPEEEEFNLYSPPLDLVIFIKWLLLKKGIYIRYSIKYNYVYKCRKMTKGRNKKWDT